MITRQMIIECGDYFSAMLNHKFPGAIVSMRFVLKPRPDFIPEDQEDMVWRGTWLIGIPPRFKEGARLNEAAYELAERIFFTHGVFIQHLIVEEEEETDGR